VTLLGGAGCIVSRVIGDVLIQIAESAPDGRTFQLGRGFLISEFPETQHVLESGEPRAVSTLDERPDPAELDVLQELGVGSVLMLALRIEEDPWGLVEVYRNEPPDFGPREIESAQEVVAAAENRLPEVATRP
jgi:GAF domain-containing protein